MCVTSSSLAQMSTITMHVKVNFSFLLVPVTGTGDEKFNTTDNKVSTYLMHFWFDITCAHQFLVGTRVENYTNNFTPRRFAPSNTWLNNKDTFVNESNLEVATKNRRQLIKIVINKLSISKIRWCNDTHTRLWRAFSSNFMDN